MGIKPLSFFLNGNNGSQIDSRISFGRKTEQSQEEVPLNQWFQELKSYSYGR